MLPPVAKNAIPLARRAPLAWPATFIASGWKAPTPSPEIPISTSSSAYFGETAESASPAPARNTPAGISQTAPRRSDQCPKTGCAIDEVTVPTRTTAAVMVYERCSTGLRKTSSAGTAPCAKSAAR